MPLRFTTNYGLTSRENKSLESRGTQNAQLTRLGVFIFWLRSYITKISKTGKLMLNRQHKLDSCAKSS